MATDSRRDGPRWDILFSVHPKGTWGTGPSAIAHGPQAAVSSPPPVRVSTPSRRCPLDALELAIADEGIVEHLGR